MKKYGIYLVLVMVSASGLNAGKGWGIGLGVAASTAILANAASRPSYVETRYVEVPSQQQPQTVVIERGGSDSNQSEEQGSQAKVIEANGKQYLVRNGKAYPIS